MAFSAAETIVGRPDFGLIHIDPEQVALCLQTYLETASKLTGVSLDDIKLTVIREPKNGKESTLVDLLECGMKLFDAIVWLTAGRPTSHPLVIDPGMTQESIPSLHAVARAVFFCYFMLVTQARYPVRGKTAEADAPKIPNFLRTIMGMTESQDKYVDIICSFEPQKFDAKWARHVNFSGLGQEVLSRFGLGVAGYRYFGPFALYEPDKTLSANLRRSFNFARTVGKSAASWDVHPLTRNPNVLTKRGNLNKNLGNLLLDCYSEETLKEMEVAKVIYKVPVRQPTHRNYLQWEEADDISGASLIFRE